MANKALNGSSVGFVARHCARGRLAVAVLNSAYAILSWLALLVLASQNGFALCVVVVVSVLSCWRRTNTAFRMLAVSAHCLLFNFQPYINFFSVAFPKELSALRNCICMQLAVGSVLATSKQ